MSGFRAQANHRLYLARLVIAAWQQAVAEERVPVYTLAQAFEIAACEHLKQAIPVIAGSRNFDEKLPTAIVGARSDGKR